MNKFALAVAIIGSINWGLIALFRYDFIAAMFGGTYMAGARILYGIIGLAGLWCISMLFRREDDEMVSHSH